MKKIYFAAFIFIITLALILALFLPAALAANPAADGEPAPPFTSFRDIPGITAEETAAIEALQTRNAPFVFGALNSADSFFNQNGEIQGFTALLCDWLSELFDIPFEIQLLEWDEIIDGLYSKAVDFTSELTPTEERLKTYMMTAPVSERLIKYFRIINRAPLSYIALERPPRYVFLRDSATLTDVLPRLDGGYISADEYAAGETADYIIFEADSYEEVYRLLSSGAVDAFIDEDVVEEMFSIYGDIVTETFYPLIYAPVSLTTANTDNAAVISVFQKALENGGRKYLSRLHSAGIDDYRRHKLYTAFTPEELEYIQTAGQISFVAEHDNYPISFYNAYDKEFQGICHDILREVEALTGLSFELKNAPGTDWARLLEMLENGEAAMVSELIRTHEREGRFLWPNTAVLTDYYALLSKSDFPDIHIHEVQNVIVGLVNGYAQTELFAQWFPNHGYTVLYDNFDAAFDALSRGSIDMVMGSSNQLLVQTNFRELTGYKANLVFNYPFESTFGFNKNEAVLCGIMDKALALIDTDGIAGQWTRRTFDYTAKITRARQPWFIGTIILLLCVIAVILYALRLTKKNAESRRLAMEAEMRRQAIAADNAALGRVNTLKNDLIATLSHEMRTPLTVMSNYAQLAVDAVQRGDYSDESIERLDIIISEANRLAKLSANFLSVFKETGEERKKAPIALHEIIRRAAKVYKPVMDKKNNKQTLEISDNLPPVYGNADDLTQVLFNLMSNAMTHTRNGEIKITARLSETQPGFITAAVCDTGSGISPGLLPHIFEKSRHGGAGTGYGLAICKEIIEAHGGGITAHSEPERGTVIEFTLPIYEPDGEKGNG